LVNYSDCIFHFNLKLLNPLINLPTNIENVQIVIIGKFLSRYKYDYGYCSLVDSSYFKCTNAAYLKQHKQIGYSY
jgi:hypothetical protein